MNETRYRRILDSWVRMLDRETVRVEVFLSEEGSFLALYIDIHFPEEEIIEAYLEGFGFSEWGSDVVGERLSELVGIRVGPGYISRVRKALYTGRRPVQLLDTLVEGARMLAQIEMRSRDSLQDTNISDPFVLRHLDLTFWPELEGACIPYSKGIEEEFTRLGIRAATRLDLYAPLPGQRHRFRRDKIMECYLGRPVHVLNVYLSDDIHEMEVRLNLTPDGSRIEEIQARPIRLPYPGLCSLPFDRVSHLTGAFVDDNLKSHVKEAVGGEKGCVHLTDSIMDLIRYYRQLTR